MQDPLSKLRFHQSRAFVRYKQAKYSDCIQEFEAQEDLIAQGTAGARPGRDADGFCNSVALNENIGHCLSRYMHVCVCVRERESVCVCSCVCVCMCVCGCY